MIYVFGDIMLDEWQICEIIKLSPEAPVPIIKKKSSKYNLGGMGNLASNLNKLDLDFKIITVIGSDSNGKKIINLLKKEKINYEIKVLKNLKTTYKKRYISESGHHILREDSDIHLKSLSYSDELFKNISKDDLVVLSDYDKGSITKELIKKIKTKTKKILVDPKKKAEFYKGVNVIKPNLKEISFWVDSIEKNKIFKLMKKNQWEWLFLTKGENGVDIYNKNKMLCLKTDKVEVTDVAGAGDLFFSILIYYFDKSKNPIDGAKKANKICNRKIKESGICLLDHDDLKPDLVWTNGVFDILHIGHLKLLKYCKGLGHKLVIGLNSDTSVKMNKGKNRPINNEKIRKKQLEELGIADEIIIFNERTPYNEIKNLKPDIIVKGGDYEKEDVVGSDISEVKIFKYIKKFSSTSIIKKSNL